MNEILEFQKKQINFWIENRFDKELPETFKLMQENLKKMQATMGDVKDEDANG